jgi:glycolate oxidase
MDRVFTADTLEAMCALRAVFDPRRRANPGKVIPVHSCREWHMAPSARKEPVGYGSSPRRN